MDYDKSSSSIVLDVAWGKVDKKSQGFIYAKNFPQLIQAIELLLNKGEPAQLRLLSNTGKNVIDTFAKEKEFFKIYKDEFKEIFQGLVGKTFKDAVEGTFPSGKIPKNVLQESKEDQGIIDSPQKKDLRLKNLQNRIAALTEELQFKDDIIAEKDRELIKLTRGLSEYKDKYDFLQRQFSFYKDHGESPTNEEPGANEPVSTRHEFIISEMKRKLQEQLLTINALREQMQQAQGTYQWYTKPLKSNKIESAPLILIVLFTITLFSLLFYITKCFVTDDQADRYYETSWWEKSGLLSRLGWRWQDWKDSTIDLPNSQAYDKVFGIKDYR
ncbi:Mps2p TDEL_0E05160 [Torulaspora delbrueckii]|uniref:Monopolar spindle protein 2 n=1 Tax=Torulaspora delbrueckii TaxID=4950 RepID=G8ZVW5_TORDE|nr:hypothetical protein TDEL_0E05160 [Torulaspora delbrueckii]CCE92759.1 hypothetical protein TDEL_0E05160 [Torulaspora delbrueckii]